MPVFMYATQQILVLINIQLRTNNYLESYQSKWFITYQIITLKRLQSVKQ